MKTLNPALVLNPARVGTAQAALNCIPGDGDLGDDLTDLLANLMHLADAKGLDFHDHLKRAMAHYEFES